jgi:hypothetical protein
LDDDEPPDEGAFHVFEHKRISSMTETNRRNVAPQARKRRRASGKAVVVAPAAPQGWPALFERAAQSSNFDIDALAKLIALKREMEADAFDQQKRRSYADINALLDVIGPAAAAKGFGLGYDAAPGAIDGTVKVTVKLMRNGVERTASVDMPMDGAGMRGNVNMSAPQAYVSTVKGGVDRLPQRRLRRRALTGAAAAASISASISASVCRACEAEKFAQAALPASVIRRMPQRARNFPPSSPSHSSTFWNGR